MSGLSNMAGTTVRCSSPANYIWIPILMTFFKFVSSTELKIVLPTSQPSCPFPDPDLYYRPVIGILSHPGDGASGSLTNATNASNIAASYVKFVESAGARVIPLIYTHPPQILLKVLLLLLLLSFTLLLLLLLLVGA